MNPWRESLGCEVNVCQAKHCDAHRMQDCALRKAYQWRVARLKLLLKSARSDLVRDKIKKMLRGLDAE